MAVVTRTLKMRSPSGALKGKPKERVEEEMMRTLESRKWIGQDTECSGKGD